MDEAAMREELQAIRKQLDGQGDRLTGVEDAVKSLTSRVEAVERKLGIGDDNPMIVGGVAGVFILVAAAFGFGWL